MPFKFIYDCTFINLVSRLKESRMGFYISIPKGYSMEISNA
jgi:hypothetical protein